MKNSKKWNELLSNMSNDNIIELLKTTTQSLNRINKAKIKAQEREYNQIEGSSRAKQTTLTANAWNLTEQYQSTLGELLYITEYVKDNFIYKE